MPEHASHTRTHTDALALVSTFTRTLRETLAEGSDRELLDGMLERLSSDLGIPALAVARAERGRLELVAAHGFPDAAAVPGGVLAADEGLTGTAFTTAAAVRCDDVRGDPRFVDAPGGRHRSALAVPMRLADRVWGVLTVASPDVAAFGDGDELLLGSLADQMGWAFESVRLRRVADERASHEERLRQGLEASAAVVTAGLTATTPTGAMERMVAETGARFPWDQVMIILREHGTLRVVAEHGAAWARGCQIAEGRGVVGHVACTGQPYLAGDTATDPRYRAFSGDTTSEMCAPLVIAGRVVGVLNVESVVRHLDGSDLTVLTQLAEQMGLVLQNTQLLSAEKETVARLHELDQLKSRLLTIASHELRTPLTVVMGFAEVLAGHLEGMPAEKAAEYAGAIARQASALSRTVDQMLLAAQIEQGALRVQTTSCELLPVVARALTGERGRAVEVLPGTDVRVRADPFRLQQVLEVILDNAIKYAEDAGRIQLDARVSGRHVVILVRDEGPGIPAAEREAIFEAFHQVGEHGIAGRRGMGLGLALARDLLQLMGGDLDLATAEGYGATFTVRLPTPESAE
jgi:signal transduction histidine kinase